MQLYKYRLKITALQANIHAGFVAPIYHDIKLIYRFCITEYNQPWFILLHVAILRLYLILSQCQGLRILSVLRGASCYNWRRLQSYTLCAYRLLTALKCWRGTAKGRTAYALTTNGGCVLCGKGVGRIALRLLIITRIKGANKWPIY